MYSFFLSIFSLLMFLMSIIFMMKDYLIMIEYEIFSLNSTLIVFSILLDWISLLFLSFVLFISSMVIYYSIDYMAGDLNINRFILLVFMFVLSMMFLIISPNLISILLGWDGLGLISYCLVIYYQNTKSFNSGMITALSNRIGDVALLISIAWMLNYGSWNFIFYIDFMKNDFYMMLLSILICLAAFTKSAQIPFSAWLPAAMAAPTPVSSLVHSSTLVTAGVYLLIRFNNVLSLNLMMVLLFISSMTMFMAGLSANFEFDLKKIIALSTLSQLGLMMSILALGDSMLAFFHLLMHALFKALLFMCAGCMIHNLNNCQDIRYMGSLINFIPLTSCFFNICNMALCGLPFLSGFYSKDLILECMSMDFINLYVYLIFYLSIGLTMMYSIRLFYYTMFMNFNGFSFFSISDSSIFMMKGMGGLIFFVIFGGSILSWLMFPTPYFICLPLLMKLMVLLVILLGGMLGLMISKMGFNDYSKTLGFYSFSIFSSSMWNLSFLSSFGVNYYFLMFGGKLNEYMDQGWSEYFGSQNLYLNIKNSTLFLQVIFNNNMKMFLTILLIWIFVMFL
uniref:NADH-ubiquinone oxidoreductase chain 5 n=1 Tax=Lopheros rubens TaxID=1588210 RepID=A0A343C4V3_9COLE|nr:NADH dehydrogenase subunit 5 [Lopheros rubens]